MDISTSSATTNDLLEADYKYCTMQHYSLIGFHGKIDWDVAKRFLQVLYLEGAMRKTRLAMKAGVNDETCTRYIRWFLEIKWIRKLEVEFALTEAGLQLCDCISQ